MKSVMITLKWCRQRGEVDEILDVVFDKLSLYIRKKFLVGISSKSIQALKYENASQSQARRPVI